MLQNSSYSIAMFVMNWKCPCFNTVILQWVARNVRLLISGMPPWCGRVCNYAIKHWKINHAHSPSSNYRRPVSVLPYRSVELENNKQDRVSILRYFMRPLASQISSINIASQKVSLFTFQVHRLTKRLVLGSENWAWNFREWQIGCISTGWAAGGTEPPNFKTLRAFWPTHPGCEVHGFF